MAHFLKTKSPRHATGLKRSENIFFSVPILKKDIWTPRGLPAAVKFSPYGNLTTKEEEERSHWLQKKTGAGSCVAAHTRRAFGGKMSSLFRIFTLKLNELMLASWCVM